MSDAVASNRASSPDSAQEPKKHSINRGSRDDTRRISVWHRFRRLVGFPASSRTDDDDAQNDDGATLYSAELLALQQSFFELAGACKSVVCCRLTPWQKAKIVSEVKKKGHITLAVGDGGNDELMIRRANVGVGITGREGTAASRAADYAIGQFRFLHTLIFVHGVWSYRRTSGLVLYIFYKAALIAFCMYIFGFYSAFSGQQFFNDPLYTLYNVMFTAAPVLVCAVLDQLLERDTLENCPGVYRSLRGGPLLNRYVFGAWMVRAALHAALIFFFSYYSLGSDTSGYAGRNHGLWFTSTLVFSGLVLLVTVRILLDTPNITSFHHIFVWASFVLFFPIVVIMSYMLSLNPDLYDIGTELFSTPEAWLTLLLSILSPMLLDAAFMAVMREVWHTYVDVMCERERFGLRIREGDVIPLHKQQATQTVRIIESFRAAKDKLQRRALVSSLVSRPDVNGTSSVSSSVSATPSTSPPSNDGRRVPLIGASLPSSSSSTSTSTVASPTGGIVGSSSSSSSSSSTRSSSSAGATPPPSADDAANAAILYMLMRTQNMSGTTLDATSMHSILDDYDQRKRAAEEAEAEARRASVSAAATATIAAKAAAASSSTSRKSSLISTTADANGDGVADADADGDLSPMDTVAMAASKGGRRKPSLIAAVAGLFRSGAARSQSPMRDLEDRLLDAPADSEFS